MKKVTLILVVMIGIAGNMNADSWTQVANFGGHWRIGAVGFSIGNKGYIGTTDYWEYDPSTDSWNQIANFTDPIIESISGFSIGNKGYVVNGTHFWEYDPSSNYWIQKANFNAGPRNPAGVGFSIGSKGYFGTGGDFTGDGNSDLWEYDPSIDSWTQMASQFCRINAVGFSINNFGYIGFGKIGSCGEIYGDLWEYSPDSNSWIQMALLNQRTRAISFAIGNRGYVGGGMDDFGSFKDIYEYNPTLDQWVQKTDVPVLNGFATGVGFNILNKGYVYIGDSTNAFWEYTPDAETGLNQISQSPLQTSLYPNPFTDKTTLTIAGNHQNTMLNIFNIQGQKVKTLFIGNATKFVVNRDDLSEGIYFYELINSNAQTLATGKMVVE